MPIPKIIHQLAPADKSKWHPVWTICSESWKNVYPSNFQHIIWSDENANDIVVDKASPPIFINLAKLVPKIIFSISAIILVYKIIPSLLIAFACFNIIVLKIQKGN